MKYRDYIFTLIKKLFVSGYLDVRYGEITSAGTNSGIEYPLTKKETEEVMSYFGKEQKKENNMAKDEIKEMTQAEREELFEEPEKEYALRSPNGMIILKQNLTFRKAFDEMLKGKKIARPSFEGFWYIDSFDGKMKIHDRFGNTLEKVDMTITIVNTLVEDWMVVE